MYKLYTAKRHARLHHQIHIGGVIHNYCIALHKRYYRLYRKYLSPHHLKAHIAKLKKLPKYAWWSALGSQAIQDIIQAFHWDLAHQLCAQYDGIVPETLNLQGMKALWGRKVSDLGLGHFVQILHHVAAQTGTVVHHIDPWFPSSKRCHVCGTLNVCITLRDRIWTCGCGVTHQRDHNVASNIFREGASSLGGGHVSLAPASNGC